MSQADKLLRKAQNSPHNLTIDELDVLVRKHGFFHRRTSGSHRIYENARGTMLNIQPDKNGKAKAYQVKQFLQAIGL
jgi:predicted RNA binding protein YcfA (HicA-like mRNA interferase family)